MNQEKIFINYSTAINSPHQTEIHFFNGNPDIFSVYDLKENSLSKTLFITDTTIANLPFMKEFISKLKNNNNTNMFLLILGSGEKYKNFKSISKIINKAIECGFNRNDTFVGIGGGVITDLTAFASSIYKRGINVEFIPTTLLGMVDACLGGKTGCDFNDYKNMIGTFYPASKIYYWPEFIQTLSENQYKSGLAEAFKTAILFNQNLFNLFKDESKKILNRDREILNIIIPCCVKAKAQIVETDLFEKNIRAYLNLGHTFGHALETVCGLGKITHGSAVAWGIGRVTELSLLKGYCTKEFRDNIFSILDLYNWDTKAIPSFINKKNITKKIIDVMHKDKKNINDNIKFVIPKNIKETIVEEINDSQIALVLNS